MTINILAETPLFVIIKQKVVPRTMKREATPCEDRALLTVKAGKGMIKENEQAHSVTPAQAVTEVNNPLSFFVTHLEQCYLLGNFLTIFTIVKHVGPNPHVIPPYAHV